VRERIELDARRLGRLPGMETNLVNNGGIGLADLSIAQSVRVVSAYCAYDHSLGYVQGAVANSSSSTAYLGHRIQNACSAGVTCDGGSAGMLYIALLLIVVLEHEVRLSAPL